MQLTSHLFRNSERLQRCLVDDRAHLTPGLLDPCVRLVQAALIALDHCPIAEEELSSSRYGPTTSQAVLAYKTARSIINKSYQVTSDNIVGKMTIRSMDEELVILQYSVVRNIRYTQRRTRPHLTGGDIKARIFIDTQFSKAKASRLLFGHGANTSRSRNS